MTKEEILTMEAGGELDALVGSLLFEYEIEWHWCWREPECGCWEEVESVHNDEGKWVNELIESHKGWGEDKVKKLPCYSITNEDTEGRTYKFWNPVEFYSTDISAAWQVMEKMGTSFIIRWDKVEGIWVTTFAWSIENEVKAKTAPEAICKAALLAKLEIK